MSEKKEFIAPRKTITLTNFWSYKLNAKEGRHCSMAMDETA